MLVAFAVVKGVSDWTLAPYLALGAILSVPLSAYTVKKLNTKRLRLVIGVVTVVLGVVTLVKLAL